MPVSLCEWRVRIGTFIHWIRDYEIREKEERLLKERTRRVKVLCERLHAKRGVPEQESGDGSETSDKSKQGDCNPQDPTDPKVRSQCSHGTAIIQSSGNASIQDLLTSCDHCIKDLLTPNDSQIKDVLAPSDTSIKELLTPTDSCVEDSLPSDVCQKDPHTASDSYSEDLMADDCHIRELLSESDSCIKGLLTASDSWEDVPLLSLESYGNEGHTPLESCNKDLLPAHDLFDTWSELQAHSGSYVSNPVNPKDSFIHELLMPRDPNLHNFLKNKDSHISKILTPKDSYIHDLLMSEDSYTIEPANFSIKELFTSHSSGVKVPFCIDATITDLPTSTEYCIKEDQITSDSSIIEQVTPSNASKEHTNSPYICTEEQNTLSEVVIEGQPLVESAVNSLSVLHDSCNIEHLDNEVRMQGNLDQSCRKEQPAGKSSLLAKSDDCTCSLNLPNTPSPTPTSLNYFVPHGLPYEEEISNASSRSPRQSTGSLNIKVDAVSPPHPCLNELLLVRAGDVELNPGPLHGSIDDILLESELLELAAEVPHDHFDRLCENLGFSHPVGYNVLTSYLMDIPNALLDLFCKWKVKQRVDSDCRAVLAEILGKAGMVQLQTKLLSGGYLPSKTSPSAPGLDTPHALKDLTEEHVDTRLIDAVLQDIEIVQLVKEVHHDRFFKLCIHLGFRHAESKFALAKHRNNIQEALIDFLFQWKANQIYGTNYRAALVEILGKADMVAIQTKLLSGGYLPSKTSLSASGQDTLHSLKDLTEEHVVMSALPDSELAWLAKHFPFYGYTELCISLGFSYVESQNVLTNHQKDTSRALTELFVRWKDKQRDDTSCRAVLAEILGKVHMFALQKRLLKGGYLPSKTSPSGGPSRPPESQTKPPAESKTKPLSPEVTEHCPTDDIQLPQNESDSDLESRVFSELSVPREILARGPESIRAYALALKDGKKKVFRTRLMLVGQEGVGKTSLKKSLTGQRFDPNEELTDGAETDDICEISIEHIELDKDDKISWSVKPKGNANDSVGVYKQVLVDHMVSTLQGNTSQEQASSEVSREPDSNESDDRHQGEAGANGEKIPDGVTQDKATSQFDSKETTDTRMYGNKTVPPLNDERSKMEATEALKESEETRKNEGLPNDVAELLEEKLKEHVEGAESGNDEGKDKASLNIWDFAGHDVYYTTHQVFFTWRAIYVIVFDLSTDLDSVVPPECRNRSYQEAKQGTKSELTHLQFIEFWLYSIYNHAVMPSSKLSEYTKETSQKTPPIFIVGTHREEVKGSEREKEEKIAAAIARIETMIEEKPFQRHVIPRLYKIENKLETDKELSDLRKHIEQVAKDEPYMGEEIPLKWLRFEEFHSTNTKNDMTLDEIRKHTQIGIESEEELLTILNFYHDLGSVIYYGDLKETESLLRDMVILNPQWLINVFKQVITVLEYSKRAGIVSDAWSTLEKYGILKDRLIEHMWDEFQERKDALVELMMKFDLICKAPANWQQEQAGCEVSDRTAKSPENIYYVPSRLPQSFKPKATSQVNLKSSVEFYIDFHGFLPEGLFHRLMARVVEQMMDRGEQVHLFYRQITMSVDDEHDALMTMLPPSKAAIKVTVFRAEMIPVDAKRVLQTPDPQSPDPNAVKKVRDIATEILDSLIHQLAKNLRYDIGFTCPHSKCCKINFFTKCFGSKSVKCRGHSFPSRDVLQKFGYEQELEALKENCGPKSPGNLTSSIPKQAEDRDISIYL